MKHYLLKELEHLIATKPETFLFIQEHALDGLWFWDLENPEEEFMDKKFWEVLGYDPNTKTHKAKEWFDLIDPLHLEIAKENLAKHLENPDYPYDQIVRYTHKSGKDVWVRCRGVAIRDENGKPIRLLGCHNDLTELKESEVKTLDLLNSYKALIDTNTLFYIKTDLIGNYTFANDCFLNTFGFKENEILGTSSLSSIYSEDHPKTFETVKKCFEEPNKSHSVILRKYFRKGVIRANNWEFYGITDASGELSEIICVGFEVTELIKRNQEIKQLLDIQAVKNQKLKQHSYVTSHNIRNSVANMLGLFEMIEKNPDDTGIYLKMLKSSVGVLDKTINNLNKLLNEEKEANYKDLKKINVKSTLKSIIDLEYIEINNQKADINLICESDIYIKTLPVFFKSVFHNLISNALKYGLTKNSKIVDITVQKSDDGLSIEVKDYGKGFNAEENEELIFKYGTRLNMDTIGQGLGLFITNHHVRLIGADIIVDSSEGKGASFKVVFEDKYICNG